MDGEEDRQDATQAEQPRDGLAEQQRRHAQDDGPPHEVEGEEPVPPLGERREQRPEAAAVVLVLVQRPPVLPSLVAEEHEDEHGDADDPQQHHQPCDDGPRPVRSLVAHNRRLGYEAKLPVVQQVAADDELEDKAPCTCQRHKKQHVRAMWQYLQSSVTDGTVRDHDQREDGVAVPVDSYTAPQLQQHMCELTAPSTRKQENTATCTQQHSAYYAHTHRVQSTFSGWKPRNRRPYWL